MHEIRSNVLLMVVLTLNNELWPLALDPSAVQRVIDIQCQCVFFEVLHLQVRQIVPWIRPVTVSLQLNIMNGLLLFPKSFPLLLLLSFLWHRTESLLLANEIRNNRALRSLRVSSSKSNRIDIDPKSDEISGDIEMAV